MYALGSLTINIINFRYHNFCRAKLAHINLYSLFKFYSKHWLAHFCVRFRKTFQFLLHVLSANICVYGQYLSWIRYDTLIAAIQWCWLLLFYSNCCFDSWTISWKLLIKWIYDWTPDIRRAIAPFLSTYMAMCRRRDRVCVCVHKQSHTWYEKKNTVAKYRIHTHTAYKRKVDAYNAMFRDRHIVGFDFRFKWHINTAYET